MLFSCLRPAVISQIKKTRVGPFNIFTQQLRFYRRSNICVLLRWQSLEKQGQLTALKTGEQTVSAAQYAQALEEIKKLQRLLGQAYTNNELLKEAVEIIKKQNRLRVRAHWSSKQHRLDIPFTSSIAFKRARSAQVFSQLARRS